MATAGRAVRPSGHGDSSPRGGVLSPHPSVVGFTTGERRFVCGMFRPSHAGAPGRFSGADPNANRLFEDEESGSPAAIRQQPSVTTGVATMSPATATGTTRSRDTMLVAAGQAIPPRVAPQTLPLSERKCCGLRITYRSCSICT